MKLSNQVVIALAVTLAGTCHVQAQSANAYLQTILVSNVANGSATVDPNLVDPWGVSFSSSSPFWVSDHLSGKSTLYNGAGAVNSTVVTIPPGAASAAGALGRPTGQVKPATTTPASFVLPSNSKAASFIFATDDGTISAWNGGAAAIVQVDNSALKAVYKGLAIGTSAGGPTLFAANFRSGKIEAYNSSWAPTILAGTFTDPAVPAGFGPFNIWNLNNNLYVTWAKQDANQYLDVAGAGNGYVSVFDQNGNLLTHLISGGTLNSPWGIAIAPPVWGAFGGDVLVGNFGDGKINAFNPTTGAWIGALEDMNGNVISISGLWALVFGNGGSGGDVKTLYFTAGVPDGSSAARGELGSLAPPAAIQTIVNAASQMTLPLAPGEIVEITGQTVGPSPAVAATIPPTGPALTTALGGASVTVNGVTAPILYTNGSQTNIQIPYEIAGATTASVILTTGSQTTAAVSLPVRPVSPGIFTINFSGSGQAVALNSDGTVNSSTNPAVRGTNIWIFATGEGVTTPASADGMTETTTGATPVAPVAVVFGSASAAVISDTTVPKDVAGVLEVQTTVPTSLPVGQISVALSVGGVSTDNIFSSVQSVYVFVK
ncbi:MAG: TIGR03118 family protein [Bryobacteraceae bacterium]|jgi:uncharacterized protein (TIGR03118 family)